ncbi:MAG: response regulator transcription factor [Bacteroidetes bacterium]|nr:response regulator transcription factor [Bacteroidota bacterium]
MTKTRLLLVEDEKNIAESLIFNLEDEYDVLWAKTGEEALIMYGRNKVDLIVLDVMLPQLSGYDVCENIRKQDTATPILFLTAKNTDADRIEGLKLGGDDYLGKPFNLDEFLLRIKGLLRRRQNTPTSGLVSIGQYSVDLNNYEASTREGKVRLTKKECLLLKLLIERGGQVVTRDEMLTQVWGYESAPSTRTVDNFIVKLRSYFEENPKEPKHILSIHGVGYKLII